MTIPRTYDSYKILVISWIPHNPVSYSAQGEVPHQALTPMTIWLSFHVMPPTPGYLKPSIQSTTPHFAL